MNQQLLTLLHKLRFLASGLYICVCLYLLALLVSAITHNDPRTDTSDSSASSADAVLAGSPNAVSNGLALALSDAGNAAHITIATLSHSTESVATTITHSGDSLAHAGSWLAHSTTHGFAAAANGIGHGVLAGLSGAGHGMGFVGHTLINPDIYVFDIPSHVISSVTGASLIDTVIQPTASEQDTVPIIDPHSPQLATAIAAMAASSKPAPAATAAVPAPPQVIWPLHGAITTLFGVPEPPYEPIHTGLDISDGKPAGVTPIKAFRAGRVIDVEHTGGLGNHVVVDHGNGVTSVYGHMNSISVSLGQTVDTTTTLGYEGTTGVSTGPHLHFEIRVDGQATDPHKFIPGQPY